jgi:ABC-2 type transport system ATP-binding protein
VHGGRTDARLWARVGYLVEGPGLYPRLTVRDHLHAAARYRRLGRSALDDIVGRMNLGRYLDVRADRLSQGNRQRLGLALALVHRPALLILDEPANGLDPAGVVEVRQLLRDLARDAVTVFMSTHVITEVARLADRVGVIHAGRLVTQLSGDRLGSGDRLVVGLRSADLAARAAATLTAAGIDSLIEGTTLWTSSAQAIANPDLVAVRLVEVGCAPTRLGVEGEDLEQVFLRLTSDPLTRADQ